MEHYDFMITVLTDLECFAEKNGFPELAEHLADTKIVAHAAIVARLGNQGGGCAKEQPQPEGEANESTEPTYFLEKRKCLEDLPQG